MTLRKYFMIAALAVLGVSCGDGGTGPSDDRVTMAVQSGDEQFGAPGLTVADPLQVVVTHPVTELPRENVTVTWRVVSGSGATLLPASTQTDENGVASTTLRLGSALGTYVVEATATGAVGTSPRFTIRAVQPPSISSAPATTNVGDTITIAGNNFSPTADDNIVLFSGFRGKVVAATATQLRVIVPLCVPARMVSVTALLGAVSGNSVNMEVRGAATSSLQLARGEARTISDPNELACFRLPGGISGYTVLLVPQNHSDVAGSFSMIQLAGLSGSAPVTNAVSAVRPAASADFAADFETALRMREHKLFETAAQLNGLRPQTSVASAACQSSAVGSRCDFQVFDKHDKFTTVTAEVKAVSAHAVIYQDIKAPAGLSTADFQTLGATFDDPIYEADIAAFGAPSDRDSNGKIIILLTPVVNELTPRNATGFIAGFFYGCDLVNRTVCSGSNGAEIFYTMTADPTAQFGDARSAAAVLRSLPPVLAHEFQHMIHFGLRSKTDALWLSEGLAHHAEDVVADAFAARGDATNAALFRSQNYTRASRYLRDPPGTSLIAENGVGTLELRGASWLFVKYLVGQYGANVLKTLTAASESSVTNVVKQTGTPWSTLLANWAVALYTDDAPALAGVTLRRELTFPNINLRSALSDGLGYPLRPPTETYADFVIRETLPASSQAYVTVQATGANPQPLSLNLAGQFGGGFSAQGVPQITIVRLQ